MTEEASEHLPHLVLVTPTYARPFQASYLTELSHLLRMVPQPFTWLVVESGVKVREGGSYSYMLLECPCSRESRRMEASSPIHVLLPLPLPLHDGLEVRPPPPHPHLPSLDPFPSQTQATADALELSAGYCLPLDDDLTVTSTSGDANSNSSASSSSEAANSGIRCSSLPYIHLGTGEVRKRSSQVKPGQARSSHVKPTQARPSQASGWVCPW